jgi:hypothetical protein
MKKVLYLLAISTLLMACSEDKSIDKSMYGHWMQKDFYEAVKNKQKLSEITADKIELILPANDTSYQFITYGQNIKSGKIELYKKNHVVIKNFYERNNNADLKLINKELHLINPITLEETIFIKLDESIYQANGIKELESFSIPFIHQQYISGTYQMDTVEVKFVDQGKVKGLGKLENFSFCYDVNCNVDGYNTIFLADKNFEGNYYAFEQKGDSLIIYDVDTYAIARGLKSNSTGIKYAMKKIN